MTESDDDMEYCAKCGDPEYDKDGDSSHDYEPYDHDFVYEKEEDEADEGQSTLEQVGEFADTVKKLAEAGKAIKKFTKTETPRPSSSFVNDSSYPGFIESPQRPSRWTEAGRDSNAEVKKKLDRLEEHHKKGSRNAKTYLGVTIVVGIILTIIALSFSG